MTSGKVSSPSLWCISDAFSRFSERNNGQILKPGPDWEVYQLLESLETHPEVLSWGIWAPSMPSARDPRHQLGAGREAPNGPGGPGTLKYGSRWGACLAKPRQVQAVGLGFLSSHSFFSHQNIQGPLSPPPAWLQRAPNTLS